MEVKSAKVRFENAQLDWMEIELEDGRILWGRQIQPTLYTQHDRQLRAVAVGKIDEDTDGQRWAAGIVVETMERRMCDSGLYEYRYDGVAPVVTIEWLVIGEAIGVGVPRGHQVV